MQLVAYVWADCLSGNGCGFWIMDALTCKIIDYHSAGAAYTNSVRNNNIVTGISGPQSGFGPKVTAT